MTSVEVHRVLVVANAELRPGMRLVSAVPQANAPGQDLIKRGVTLDDEAIGRLRERGVPWLYVDFPPLAELDRQVEVLSSPARLRMMEKVREVHARAARPGQVDLGFVEIYQISRDLITTILGQGLRPLVYDPGPRDAADLPGHVAAVTQSCLTIGIRLERYLIQQRSRLPGHHAREVVNLGVAAMLHDVGLMRLDPTLQLVSPVKPPEDVAVREQWQSHARLGYELIKEGVEASAASAVLHHHQAFDGSGFPRLTLAGKRVRWAGKRLHVFARILAAANLFDRYLTAAGDSPVARLTALSRLRSLHARSLDGIVVKALHQVCPPFPPGSVVTLDDGTHAVVVHVDDEQVFRPVVRRLGPMEGGSLLPTFVGDAVDLRIDPSRQIIEVMGHPTEGLLCTSQTLDGLARSAEDPADREEVTALRGEDAERAYARHARPVRPSARLQPAADPKQKSPAPIQRGGRDASRDSVEEIPEPDLPTSPPLPPQEAINDRPKAA